MKRIRRVVIASALTAVMLMQTSASAIHFYRGPGSGCSAADGALSDDPVDENGDPVHGPSGATVQLWHNSYADTSASANGLLQGLTGSDAAAGVAVTKIDVGESVTWTWNSAHCHSVTGSGFNSGLRYPSEPPESAPLAPGLFDYPVLDTSPTLSYTRTFNSPGVFTYSCVHHFAIGMVGVIVVKE